MPSKLRQVAVYPDYKMLRKIEKESVLRNRKLGPTILEILKEYFGKPKGGMDVRTGTGNT